MLKRVISIFDRIISFLDGLAATIVVLVMLLICVHVFARYVMHRPIDWVVQVSEYSLLLIVVLGSAWVLKLERHVSMDILVIRLKERTQSLLNFITSIIGTLVCVIIVWYSFKTSLDLFQRGTLVMGEVMLPQCILTSLVLVCFLLLLIQFVRRTFGYYRSWRAK